MHHCATTTIDSFYMYQLTTCQVPSHGGESGVTANRTRYGKAPGTIHLAYRSIETFPLQWMGSGEFEDPHIYAELVHQIKLVAAVISCKTRLRRRGDPTRLGRWHLLHDRLKHFQRLPWDYLWPRNISGGKYILFSRR